MSRIVVPLVDKMNKGYRVVNGCWIWQGYIQKNGYGKVRHTVSGIGKFLLAHRAAYTVWVGDIPGGHQIDHLCRVRLCVNPKHLEAVTPRVNVMRSTGVAAINARKTHCPRGHEYSGDNLYLPKGKSIGERHCRACQVIRVVQYKQRQLLKKKD